MSLFYRIEHKQSKLGPFQYYNLRRDQRLKPLVDYFSNNFQTFPSFREEKVFDLRDRQRFENFIYDKRVTVRLELSPDRFAFESLKQLKSWFHDEFIKVLDESEFVLTTYSLNDPLNYIKLSSQILILDISKASVHSVQNLLKKV